MSYVLIGNQWKFEKTNVNEGVHVRCNQKIRLNDKELVIKKFRKTISAVVGWKRRNGKKKYSGNNCVKRLVKAFREERKECSN